uniref:Endoglucanase n=1 Tax=unidentified microorganism TaxID=81726 RepID=A9UGW2_9ZZZZ|nr:endoglucanase [unidentified microorganism]
MHFLEFCCIFIVQTRSTNSFQKVHKKSLFTRFFMNKHFKTLFSGFIALCCAMILTLGCSSPSVGSVPVPTLPEGSTIDLSSSSVTADAIVNSMKFGWNLGNTLDAHEGNEGWSSNKGSVESDWGMKGTASQALFNKLYDSGIRTVRIPISWHNHVDSSMNIDSGWMNHVKEIVNMAYSKGMFVIINIHHDNYEGSSLGTNAGFTLNAEDETKSLAYVEKIWTQISAEFKDYDGHVVFETLNEPRVIGGTHEWGCDGTPEWGCTTCQQRFAIINALNQKAVDTIRASGGNNANRLIMFPAYVAAPYAAIKGKQNGVFTVPSDPNTVNKRLALSVHMYTPYNFAMNCTAAEGAHSDFKDSDKTELNNHFTALKSEFIDKGIPVVIGEMGATNKNNFEARKSWFSYYLGLCKTYNVAAVLWDNGKETNPDPKEAFGFMDRSTNNWYTDSQAAELIAAAVEARGTSGSTPSGSSENWTSIWTGST